MMPASAYSYDQIIETPLGEVVLMADLYVLGDTVELRELIFYPVGRDYLPLGTALVRSLYRQIEADLKSIGYKRIIITGHRTSGANPGRNLKIVRIIR